MIVSGIITVLVISSSPVLYSFVNVNTALSVPGLTVSVPSPLSVTVNVIVFVVSESLVTPRTLPLSVTVYVYVPGTVNVMLPNS